ncbi:MAG: CoA transferase [Dehalococcoidia bacterium]|nr:CoA transferase [Dehalococcoidia bacterium]HRC62071.1 CoA transferase [Dehalococcoidia bacterium]
MPSPADERDQPLAGVRILDLTVVWAGPYATMHLADWGAEIIRIESLHHFASFTRGTLARPSQALVDTSSTSGMGYPEDRAGEHPWNRSPVFNHHGRNKRSMTLDLTRPEGQEVFERLVRESDGMIENNLPPHAEELGVTWDRLSKINPRFILMRVPGFGVEGPYRDYRTFGNHMEAIAGHPVIRAYPDLGLDYAPASVPADAASGVGGALAFTLALRQRERTGKGVYVELATAENYVPFLSEFVLDYSMNGRVWEQMGNDHWTVAPHNAYPCQGMDRWVTIACTSEDDWRALCGLMGRPGLATDERFADMPSRHANRRDLDAEISAWTREHDAHWVTQRLQALGVAAGVVLHESELLRDRHLDHRGYWQTIEHPETGVQQNVGRLWRASDTPHPPARHAPMLGQDNDYVYRELLGFSDEEYRAFIESGHIGTEYDASVP